MTGRVSVVFREENSKGSHKELVHANNYTDNSLVLISIHFVHKKSIIFFKYLCIPLLLLLVLYYFLSNMVSLIILISIDNTPHCASSSTCS